MGNWTPGPWEAAEPYGVFPVGEGEVVALMGVGYPVDQRIDNCRLIAAAPALVAALEALMAHQHGCNDLSNDCLNAWLAARDALALVEGEK